MKSLTTLIATATTTALLSTSALAGIETPATVESLAITKALTNTEYIATVNDWYANEVQDVQDIANGYSDRSGPMNVRLERAAQQIETDLVAVKDGKLNPAELEIAAVKAVLTEGEIKGALNAWYESEMTRVPDIASRYSDRSGPMQVRLIRAEKSVKDMYNAYLDQYIGNGETTLEAPMTIEVALVEATLTNEEIQVALEADYQSKMAKVDQLAAAYSDRSGPMFVRMERAIAEVDANYNALALAYHVKTTDELLANAK